MRKRGCTKYACKKAPAPAEVLFVDADHRPAEDHPLVVAHGHAAVPPRADDDVVRAAEAVEEGAGDGEVMHGRVQPGRVRKALAPVRSFSFSCLNTTRAYGSRSRLPLESSPKGNGGGMEPVSEQRRPFDLEAGAKRHKQTLTGPFFAG